jgi:anti-sigma-K factor RskA
VKSYLQHLESNEAVLLMYLGNELPEQDRVEVEAMLASDSRLRSELENLRKTHQLAFDALESLDAITRPPMPPIAAQNRISELIREWVDRRRRSTAAVSGLRRQFPWWRSTFAAAASLMVVYYIWAVYHTAPVRGLPPVARPPHVLTDNEKLALLYNSFEISNSQDSNLVDHVAEVASVVHSDPEDSTDSSSSSDSNSTGAP